MTTRALEGSTHNYNQKSCGNSFESVKGKFLPGIKLIKERVIKHIIDLPDYRYNMGISFDEMAQELGKDAVQLRLELLQDVKKSTDEKIQYSSERMENAIKLAAEKGGWGKAKEGVYQGFSAYYSHNTHVAEVAEVILKDGLPVVTKVVAAVDCGIVVNPTGAINQVQGGVLDGIGHAMYGDLTFKDGKPSNKNFDTYRLIRMNETPQVEVHFVL